jgi:hypothetical protein
MKHLERFHICATWRMSGKRPQWNEDGSWTHCANGDELKSVEVFKYLGRLISYEDADSQAMRSNFRKACGCWSRVYCMLWAENVTPKTCRIFYNATVQAALLCISKTWGLSPSSKTLGGGFHIRATWRMSGKRPQWNGDGSWTHPRSEKVLEAAGMKTIAVDVHHQTVANFIVNRPLHALHGSREEKRLAGPSFLVGSADGLRLGEGGGPLALLLKQGRGRSHRRGRGHKLVGTRYGLNQFSRLSGKQQHEGPSPSVG